MLVLYGFILQVVCLQETVQNPALYGFKYPRAPLRQFN